MYCRENMEIIAMISGYYRIGNYAGSMAPTLLSDSLNDNGGLDVDWAISRKS
jgi:hypothetical protein